MGVVVELVVELKDVLVVELEDVLLVVVREKEDKKADGDLGVEMREGFVVLVKRLGERIVARVRSDLWLLV